ncbi:hypothetical protein [Yoonia sp. BS5-3]|uniref:Glycosyl transferase family 2 n=1 Tax=Yoonia phaeophyticola TaxID=3137369 RepID=A0ABZ2V482_9RHOB
MIVALLSAIDYPRDRLSVVFCEGGSKDQTAEKLSQLVAAHKARFRSITVINSDCKNALDQSTRWLPQLQFERRSNLARVRNRLADAGISDDTHWALWIDADVCDYDPGIVRRLIAARAEVVTPDCVRDWDGPSYDLNAFNDDGELRNHAYYKHVKAGLYMPPADRRTRRHLHVFRFLDRVPLSSVGGTMLLVHASVHQAGIRFPEIPYDHLLETEGFGRICRDFGIQPFGLPNLQIKHVKS